MSEDGSSTGAPLVTALRQHLADGDLSPPDVVASVLNRIAAAGDDKVWIARPADDELIAAAERLERRRAAEGPGAMPLYGIPFAVKDNIDVAGLPTTAACPEFSYVPQRSAAAVERLLQAGALCVGKTNLDQFATGLVGVRSPYGTPVNPHNADYVPGGSSSGSAVAVAKGLVSFALGTDTAGSGRVPAGFNNIVGLKPTRGAVSVRGVVPACATLDCVSVFALTVEDSMDVLAVLAGADEKDPFSRTAPAGWRPVPAVPGAFRFGVPKEPEFFGDPEGPALFAAAVARMETLGGRPVEIDLTPFTEAAALLYQGPWVAERTAAIADFLRARPEALHPVTRAIIEPGFGLTAIDAFKGLYRLEALRWRCAPVWDGIDTMLLPTAGRAYTVAEVEADPIRLNGNLGLYTNFVNMLDLSALAVPSGFARNGMPFGVTLVATAWHEARLAGIGAAMHRAASLPLGATGAAMPPAGAAAPVAPFPRIEIAVFGAHMRGMALSAELTALGARFARTVETAPCYRLYAIANGSGPARPGLVRVTADGASIEGEVWQVPLENLGAFVVGIPAPLGIGTVTLAGGVTVKGFVCEGFVSETAADVTRYRNWRAYCAAASPAISPPST